MKTYIVLYRVIRPGNFEEEKSYKGQARTEELFRQQFAVMCAALYPKCEISIQGVSEI